MKLIEYRTQCLGISAREAARSLGVAPPVYWRWESEKGMPDRESLQRIYSWSQGHVTANDMHGMTSIAPPAFMLARETVAA